MADPKDPKEPFVSQSDRPEVKIDPEKSVSELRVRDLQSILGAASPQKSVAADIKQTNIKLEKVEKFEKHEKVEKFEVKELKHEKNEIKDLKHEKIEVKDHKLEKLEHKDFKFEKVEFEPIPVPGPPVPGPNPEGGAGPVGLAQLVEHVGGLHKKIDDLANQVAELKKNK